MTTTADAPTPSARTTTGSTRATRAAGGRTHPGPGDQREGGAPVGLSDLLDLQAAARTGGEDIPCRQHDPELWFADTPDGVEFAKALCGTCPARNACLRSALERGEPWGVWGGELLANGTVVARKRPRGRPRKTEVAA